MPHTLVPLTWMTAPSTKKVMSALQSRGAEARFVGGCVRDALLNRPIKDIDIATTEVPEKVIELLVEKKIKVIPTGLEHGTVTAVIGHQTFEITTLRRDVETNGRHAVVKFTDNWKQDAERRDFTMNALSADMQGTIYDYVGGYDDALTGNVRFIGNATTRIREDVLRILRFYRFLAHYGVGKANTAARTACQKAASALSNLASERIQEEILTLFQADAPLDSIELMRSDKILVHCLPEAEDFDRLKKLLAIEALLKPHWPLFIIPDAILRLAALLSRCPHKVSAVSARLKFSKALHNRLLALANTTRSSPGQYGLNKCLYEIGPESTRDFFLLNWARCGVPSNHEMLLTTAAHWEKPKFPLTGQDVLATGTPAGPMVGKILKRIEDWWVHEDFEPDRVKCLGKLHATISHTQ